jgi:hypothetical protein
MTVFDGKVVFDVANDPAGQDAIEDAHGVELDLRGEAASMGSEWHRN